MAVPINYRSADVAEDAIRETAHIAIGRAMEHWQHLETALYLLAHFLMDADHKVTSIVFFHVKSAENRVGLIDKLCWEALPQQHYTAKWKPLRKRLSKMIEVRNGLAHFELATFTPDASHRTAFPVAVTPHHLDVSAYRTGPTRGLYLERIASMAPAFTAAADETLAFALRAVPDPMRRAESLPPSLRQCLEKAHRMNSTPRHPRRP